MCKKTATRILIKCLTIIVSITLCWIPDSSLGDDASPDSKQFIDFDARLNFYLDLKTKRFLERISIKEEFTIRLIESVMKESKSRKLLNDKGREDGLELLYSERNQLIDEYAHEIDLIIKVIDQIDELEKLTSRSEDYKLLNEIDRIKDELLVSLESDNLQSEIHSDRERLTLIEEYSAEVAKLIDLYDQIVLFEKSARVNNDVQLLQQIGSQKKRITSALEASRLSSPIDYHAVKDYVAEVENIVQVLREFDKLEFEAKYEAIDIGGAIESAKDSLLRNVDSTVLNLLGYSDKTEGHSITVSDYFREWKASRLAEIHIKLTQYRVIKEHLLKSALPEERDRMLERDMSDALLNYTNEKYELAIDQFQEIYDNYRPYYENLDGVLFYLHEANFASGYFETAYKGFMTIAKDYPASPFLPRIYARLLFISFTYGWDKDFFNHFDTLVDYEQVFPEDLDEANYLAGYLKYRNNEFDDARLHLERVASNSKYGLAARYLEGIVSANLNDYQHAKTAFKTIMSVENLPWTDLNTTFLKNESCIKLAYIYYQHAAYDSALLYFDQVSQGYNGYDKSLLGKAWSNLKKGEIDKSLLDLNELMSNFIFSNYTYESRVLSAHCRRLQDENAKAIKEFTSVTEANKTSVQAKDYMSERKILLERLHELENIEEQILERQDGLLYPKIASLRESIEFALQSFTYRGVLDKRILDEYQKDRKLILHQIVEFETIMQYAETANDMQMYDNASTQRDKLLSMMDQFPEDDASIKANNFLNYPIAIHEQGYIYQKELVQGVMRNLLDEKQRVNHDLDIISDLIKMSDSRTQMEIVLDLEILEEDLRDLHNQIDKYQVWLSNHQLQEVDTHLEYWSNVSGFSISDINYTTYQEQRQKIETLDKNMSYIDRILNKKRELLERRIAQYDEETLKIERELESEKIRVEKLEKERYFRDIYFDTRTREVDVSDELERVFDLDL